MSDISRSAKMTLSKHRLKRPISPFLEMGFKKFFDSYMQNYEGKLKMIRRNRFDTDCENG